MTGRLLVALGATCVTLAAASPFSPHAAGPRPAADRRPVPILMYHVIADPPRSAPSPTCTSRVENSPRRRRCSRRLGTRRWPSAWCSTLARPGDASAPPDRPLLRRRLPQPGHGGAADPRHAALARRAEPRPFEPHPLLGCGSRGVRRPMAAGWEIDSPFADAPRPHCSPRRHTQAWGGGLASG